ncbi:MAG: SlyX family protein [Planctomycetota bacterium]
MSSPDDRVTKLEENLAHLQRQYDLLNEVVIEQSLELNRTRKQIAKWERLVESLKNRLDSPSDLLDEKPPHY